MIIFYISCIKNALGVKLNKERLMFCTDNYFPQQSIKLSKNRNVNYRILSIDMIYYFSLEICKT